MIKFFNLFILIILGLTSCRSTKDVTYFQEGRRQEEKVQFPNFEKDKKQQAFEAVIQPNDILAIYVNSLSPEATIFFNATNTPDQSSSAFTTRTSIGYLVDASGFIEMPLIGKVKLGGLTTQVAKDTLTNRLDNYLQDPTVRIYFENFRVTILGEVARPGVFTVTNEKLTLTEAIGMAGDLTVFGDRRNVLLIREEKGVKNYIKLDLTKREVLESPYYFLHSNDVLYIEPVKARVAQADNFYRVAPFVMSTLTLIAVLITRYTQ